MFRPLILSVLLQICLVYPIYCQSDTLSNCASKVDSLALVIASIGFPQDMKSLEVIKEWETLCEYSEPAERLRILMAIERGVYSTSTHLDYLEEGIRRYRSRLQEADSSDARIFYQEHAAWFCYLPLNHPFDVFTKELAESLLVKQKPGTGEYLMCILFTGQLKEFERQRVTKPFRFTPYHTVMKVRKPVEPIFRGQKAWVVRSGIWIPLGESRPHFGPGIYGGAAIQGYMNKEKGVLIGANIDVIVNRVGDDFSVVTELGSTPTTSDYQIGLGINFMKRYGMRDKDFIDLSGGIGVAWLFTDAKQFSPDNAEEDTAITVNLGTFDIPLGLAYTIGTRRGHAIGVHARYHLRPFSLDRRLLSPLAMGSITSGVHFMF